MSASALLVDRAPGPPSTDFRYSGLGHLEVAGDGLAGLAPRKRVPNIPDLRVRQGGLSVGLAGARRQEDLHPVAWVAVPLEHAPPRLVQQEPPLARGLEVGEVRVDPGPGVL